jgi:O-methyltransferase
MLRAGKRGLERALFAAWQVAVRKNVDTTHYDAVIPEASYAPWKSDLAFQATLSDVRDNTVVDHYRLWELWNLTHQLSHTPGDILEVGVWRGGSGCLMAKRSRLDQSGSTVFLCDTFSGVVKASENDTAYVGGEFADTSLELVAELARSMNLDNVDIRQGMFPDDAGADLSARPIKLCHIDVDTYESAKTVSEWAWKKLVVGGVIVYDDYGFFDTPGVTRAVNEQVGQPDRRVLHNLNGHGIVVKVG